MDLFKNLFRRRAPTDQQKQQDIAESGSAGKRLTLARDSETSKEILYYLAENDPDPKIRKAVAQNASMPPHVSPILAVDGDADVRLALAGRLVELLPEMSQDEQSQLYAYVVQALGTLALDEVIKIRAALSSTLKDHAHTPPKIAGQLARDVEREVSEPILRFCATLSDDDLVDILKEHPDSWVVEAVARRDEVSAEVSGAVIETKNEPGGRALIENDGAEIGESLLHYIVARARDFPEWQKPIAARKSLPISIAKEMAEFVDASVRDILFQREDFDEHTTEEIAAVFRRRVEFASDDPNNAVPIEARLKQKIEEGTLNEEAISDALAMRDTDFAFGAIAYMAKTDIPMVEKIMGANAAKSIVALCWRAGLSMRLALLLQKDVAHVQPKELIYPKDGSAYPLTEDQLNWQLEFLGLES